MAFFPDESVVKQTTPIPTDYAHADLLRKLVVASASRVRRWRRTAWADEFRILRQELTVAPGNHKFVGGFPELAASAVTDRIARVLGWYTQNYGKPDVPELLSAAAFRKHFDWLERLSKKADVPQVTYSEDTVATATALYAALRGRQWGRGTANLEASIFRSVHRLGHVLAALRPLKQHSDVGPFVRWVWPRLAGDTFLRNWYEDLWKSVHGWDAWSGSFKGVEFAQDAAPFAAKMTGWAAEYGDKRFWTKVRTLTSHDVEG